MKNPFEGYSERENHIKYELLIWSEATYFYALNLFSDGKKGCCRPTRYSFDIIVEY